MAESVTIRTGKMGHGKTLNAIKEIDNQAFTENRIVYYHNIDGLQPEMLKAQWYEFDTPHEWYKLPDNAIIVIDEAQRFFGVRDPRSEVPLYISQLETIRHQGHEIVFITQDHRFLDVNIRRLCGSHIHFKRLLGSNKVARYEFLEASDYEKPSVIANADKTYIKLDKSVFGVYKSASSHHFKVKIPKKFYLFGVIVGLAIFLLFYVFNGIANKAKSDTEQEAILKEINNSQLVPEASKGMLGSLVTGSSSSAKNDTKDKAMSLTEYLDYYRPRIEGLPHTAPAYDKLTEPQSYPRLSCMLTESEEFINKNKDRIAVGVKDKKFVACSCYTQQATLYKTPFNLCVNIVENGYFDPAKPDVNRQQIENGTDSNAGFLDSSLANK